MHAANLMSPIRAAISLTTLLGILSSRVSARLDFVCAQIASSISSQSAVFFPGDPTYLSDIAHWANSSTQPSICTVEPGTAQDVSTILGILASTNTSFAVKGGGHGMNPGFSSTAGVQIAMKRFSEVTYNTSSQTATIGTGLIWDDVYAALAPYGVNVVGGRIPGIGVAGFTLGGGYSWKSNQFGLTVDTVQAFELVKPSGEITTVTQDSDPDLFFGLKGGFNNFGIVTRFVLATHPQGEVWGGLIVYDSLSIPAVNNATVKFSATNTDPKASLITAYDLVLELSGITLLLFYDGPNPPAGTFDDFLAIPFVSSNVKTADFLSIVQAYPTSANGPRGIFHSVSLRVYTPTLLAAIANETVFWGTQLRSLFGTNSSSFSYDVETFLPQTYTHNASPSAYPPSSSRDLGLLLLNIYFAWAADLLDWDSCFYDVVKQSATHIRNVALSEGQDIENAPIYPNYAIFDTPLEHMYSGSVPMLRRLRERVDPDKVMYLTGGFKF